MNRTNNPEGAVKNGVHVLRLRVYHEDTDYTGVVYHGSYVRFAERGRSDFLRACGYDHTAMRETSPAVALMVYRMEIDYLGAARISDMLEVETRVARLTKARMEMAQSIRRGSDLLCRMKVVVVAAIPGGRAQRFPEALVAALERGNSPVEP
ncbi:MAG: YbgC/FadM family acyl-CoA thioesterase [Hyphomicrobiales bacterium]|nr:YbgC/FadM family acyl-CoA thioesterase [Hyphomicrobiales bacterium]MCY4039162.1 YbgC/FadM family acyl-CoA thioesterase [Hyphomicrobiales bacterium]